MFDLKENEVLDFVNQNIKEIYEYEDYHSFISVHYPRHCLEFQFEFDSLKCVNFGVLFNDKDEPLWSKYN